MDWRSEYETSRRVLYRIVSVLLALADLAHRADGLPCPVRWVVVHILRKAEGVAREFIFEPAESNDSTDPTDLATSFRRMALSLRNTLRRLRRELSCWTFRDAASTCQGHQCLTPALLANGPAFAAPPHPDTS